MWPQNSEITGCEFSSNKLINIYYCANGVIITQQSDDARKMLHFKFTALTGTPGTTQRIFENFDFNMQSFLIDETKAYNLLFNKKYIKLAQILTLPGTVDPAKMLDF